MYKQSHLGVLSWGLGLAFLGCGGSDDAGSGSSGEFREFATYWADNNAWCGYMDNCEIQERRDCERYWATAAETEGALEATDLAASDVEQCEQASHELDACVLTTACEDYSMACPDQFQAFDNACAQIHDALRTYLNEHRGSPVNGAFFGEYYGDETGTFAGVIESDGSVSVDVFVSGLGEVAGEGTVDYNASAEFHTLDSADGDPLTFVGELEGSGPTFDGSGIWVSDAGLFGSWTLTSSDD